MCYRKQCNGTEEERARSKKEKMAACSSSRMGCPSCDEMICTRCWTEGYDLHATKQIHNKVNTTPTAQICITIIINQYMNNIWCLESPKTVYNGSVVSICQKDGTKAVLGTEGLMNYTLINITRLIQTNLSLKYG